MKKIITLLFSVTILSASAQCVMTGNAIPGPCSPTTNTYSVNGFVAYVNPPTTGVLVITSSCGGTPVILTPPFTGGTTTPYTIPGITADGASCTVTMVFSDLSTCIYTAMYTAPVACATSCVATGFATPGACNPPTNDFTLTGSYYFVGEPTTGTFNVINSCGGSQTFNAPFTSPINFSISGVPANGAGCTVTGSFSAIPTCMYAVIYTAPAACGATSVDENAFLSNLNIAPNPSTGSINLSFNQSVVQSTTIEIIDVLGRSIYSQVLPKFTGEYSQKVDLTAFNKGIYFVKISGEKGSEIRKIIYH